MRLGTGGRLKLTEGEDRMKVLGRRRARLLAQGIRDEELRSRVELLLDDSTRADDVSKGHELKRGEAEATIEHLCR